MLTSGPHGGYFPWREHIFPLRVFQRDLWIPLPIIGSVFPISRQLGVTDTDMMSASYREYIQIAKTLFSPGHPGHGFHDERMDGKDAGGKSRHGHLLRSLRRIQRSPFLRRWVWRRLRDYNRPDFHPDDHDTDTLLEQWRTDLFGADGRLNDKLTGAS